MIWIEAIIAGVLVYVVINAIANFFASNDDNDTNK